MLKKYKQIMASALAYKKHKVTINETKFQAADNAGNTGRSGFPARLQRIADRQERRGRRRRELKPTTDGGNTE